MAIPAIASVVSSVAPKVLGAIGSAVAPRNTLSKDDFLKLLVSQLKNQDPLNPLSNDQFIQQSTAFSSLEALQNIQQGITNLGGAGSAQTLASSAGLLGRPVVASTGTFQWSGQPVSLPYTIAAPVANAAVQVTDASGTTIAQIPLGARTPGQYGATFVPPSAMSTGQYQYRIVSMDGGQTTPLSAIGGSVTGISLSNGQPVLQVGSVTIKLADVTTIGTPTN
jgi:flagellar basal-body rod modification protein FlgD